MASTRITRTLSANGDKKLTISVWLKRSGLSVAQYICRVFSDANNQGGLNFTSGDTIEWFDYVGGAYKLRYITNAVFRDTSAWYHILAHFDNSLSTPEAKLYVNGVEQSLSTSTNYTQNQTTSWNNNYTFDIGSAATGTYFDGSMAHFYFIQNQKYAPTIFGESDSVSGIWKPIASPTIDYSATGSNSCHLKFENSANMDLDSGSNNVSFTTSGSLTQNVDTPSNVFATLNPLYNQTGGQGVVLANGNTRCSYSPNSSRSAFGTIAVGTGKYYYEAKLNTGGTGAVVGVVDLAWPEINGASGYAFHDYAINFGYDLSGQKTSGGSATAFGSALNNNDIVQVAMDLDNSKLYFGVNGTWQNSGDPTSGASGTGSAFNLASDTLYTSACRIRNGGDWSFNFGQGYFGTTAVASAGTSPSGGGIFEFDCPSGYQSLSTKGINSF